MSNNRSTESAEQETVIKYEEQEMSNTVPQTVEQESAKDIPPANEGSQDDNIMIRKYTDKSTTEMFHFGMSIQGKTHIGDNIPCQDFHKIEILNAENNIGIAVVSDGAGSAMNSAEGSKMVCESSIKYLGMAITKLGWLDEQNLPDETTWDKVIREVIRLTQIDLNNYAKEKKCELKSYAATFLILFFTPKKSFFAHVGDGRAGVKIGGNWEAILTPHKGEEENQTVFLTNEILTPIDLKISGVSVPETKVIDASIEAFILMSDGCENGMWLKNKKEEQPDGGFKYIAINQPFKPAIEALLEAIKEYDDKKELLYQFLEKYNASLQIEPDDKTVVFGFLK
jgi:hypothetical protein